MNDLNNEDLVELSYLLKLKLLLLLLMLLLFFYIALEAVIGGDVGVGDDLLVNTLAY